MKTKLFLLIIIFLSISQFSEAQFKFKPEFSVGYGFENNIFKAPEKLLLPDLSYIPQDQLILSDQFIDYGYSLKGYYKLKKKHKFSFNQSLWGRNYMNYPSLNQFDIELQLAYQYKINKKMDVGVSYNINKTDKIGTSVLGDELTQLFSYIKNDAELFFSYDISKNTNVEINAYYMNKSYKKDPAVTPLDYNYSGTELRITQDINIDALPQRLYMNFSISNKNYIAVISADANGNKLNTNPLRQWRYYKFEIADKFYFSKKFAIKPYFKYDIRQDLFQDYYTYSAYDLGLKFYLNSNKLHATLTPSYSSTMYKVKTAPDPLNPNPKLIYNYVDLDTKIAYNIASGFSVIAEFSTKNRNTNTIDESYKTRRSYSYYEALIGIGINPSTLFEEKVKRGKDD